MSETSGNRRLSPARWMVLLGALLTLAFFAFPAYADVGPKPTMHFYFAYQIAHVSIVGGQQIECEDAACASGRPLQQLGPQGFRCYQDECSSLAYGYRSFHKLVVQFSDRTRESNVFQMSGFSGDFVVTVREQDVQVRQAYSPASIFEPTRVVFQFPIALSFTLVIELAVAFIYLRLRNLPLRILIRVFVANLISVPVVWFVIPLFGLEPTATTILSELFAVVFEALFIYLLTRNRISLRDPFALSLIMNAVSFLIGLAVSGLLDTFS